MWRGDPETTTLPGPPPVVTAPRPLHPTPLATPLATPLVTPQPSGFAILPLPPTQPTPSHTGGPVATITMPPPAPTIVAPQPAPTPNDLMESERARMSSVSLLRRRAFEETSKIHEERETTMSQDLEAARSEASTLRSKLATEQEAAQAEQQTLRAELSATKQQAEEQAPRRNPLPPAHTRPHSTQSRPTVCDAYQPTQPPLRSRPSTPCPHPSHARRTAHAACRTHPEPHPAPPSRHQ